MLLLAVSGGLDSTVMAHLFQRAGIPCALVHVHYGLRGEESLEDMRFVADLAKQLHFPYHLYDAAAEMRNTPKPEIQQAARVIRYRVFGEICAQFGYRTIALAHHRDDQEEHFWMYRKRGNILSALSGMPEHRILSREDGNATIVRPLLFTDRKELFAYAEAEGIAWREDRSNASPDYLRNRIRLQQIPELKSNNPEAYSRFTALLAKQRPLFTAFKLGLRSLDRNFVSAAHEHIIRLNREAILQEPLGVIWLRQYLARFGFHPDLAARIFASGCKNGLRFRGKSSWGLYSHAEGWYLVPERVQEPAPVYLKPEDTELSWCGHRIRLQLVSASDACLLPRNRNIMLFDAAGLKWPLMLRNPQAGDRMLKLSGGHVKVGDLCTNLKIPVFKRPLLPLLYSGGELLAILGLIRSGAQLITERSERVLVVEHGQ